MKNHSTPFIHRSPEEEALQANSVHALRETEAFPIEDVETSIPERFEKIVRMHPEQIAVKTHSQSATYAELNAMANRVARALLTQRGNEPEAIALLLEKRAPLMAAMLGVLKAGKYFILLDSSFPKARNVALLEDSQARLVIADRENVSLAQDMITSPRSVREFESIDLSISPDNLNLHILPGTFGAILYTSGSTGEPKGIICDHQDLLHRAMLRRIENQACEHDRIALLPTGTANAVTNSFFALLNGATLCPFDTQKEGVIRLAKWISEERITICPFSSSLFRSFAGSLTGRETFCDLRIVRLRSETVYRSDIDLYKKYFPAHCTFVTGLSSSETGQLTTYVLNDDSIEIEGDGVPIGYPVRDKEILLLDDAGNEVGANQVGEIVVRSRYLAVGYWQRPELTEAKFKADPNGNGQRLCFTGDLGLRLPDGCLVYKGRKDFRIKIRGYGVELAEVERRLLEHSAIREAVLVARQTESSDAHLAAYYTVRDHSAISIGELRRFLTRKLPFYMIPSVFVLLDVMPLTPNGKIDRTALPKPENRRPDLDTVYRAPRTPNEEKLAKILAALLGVDPIGTDDNFFDLGGHSLSAVRLIARIQNEFQVDVPLTNFLESPTIAALGKFIEQADPGDKPAKDVFIRPAAKTETFPVSFPQQRLWFLDQLFPQGFAYNMLSAYRLTGRLNLTALEKSINEIVRRHEIWRTVFTAIDGAPRQVVLPHLSLELPVVDLKETVSDEDLESAVSHRLKTEAQAPFDLAHGPLVRLTLLRLREDEYVLLLTKHHLVYDGWCRGIFARELTVLYEAFSNSQASLLAELPIQYSDFAVWQRQWFQGAVLEEQLSFWKKQLENFQTLQLPTDHPRPSVQTNRGARRYFALSETLSAGLKNLSKEHDVTLFITLLAAFKTLLYRYTGQTDILVGTSVAGRNRSELEHLIGFFLNTLPLRTDLSGNPTFEHVLALVREVCFGAYAHQDLPFEKLVEELRPERNLSHNPVFQVAFTFQNAPRFPLKLAGLRTEELEINSGITRFDLELYFEEGDCGLQGYINYNTDLFDEATIVQMLGHFESLLEGLVRAPGQRISDLSILTEAERRQLLVEWNDTRRDYPKDKCIHALFEEQVERSPESIAVVFEDQQLSYRELNTRANRVAHYLRKLGVRPETLVGICMERSIDMIVGLLGILKAGGAYVPLDPNYPEERLAFMLEDTQAAVLLTQSEFVSQLPKVIEDGRPTNTHNDQHRSEVTGPRFRRVCLDTDWEQVAKESSENPISGVTAENLAYVIYTSGSTGRPKGAMISHWAISNHMLWMQESLPLHEGDRVLQKTPFSFDASTWEFYAPLLAGARLVIAPPRAHQDSACLIKILADQQVTILQLVPSTLSVLVEKEDLANCQSLRRVFCGGEVLRFQLTERFCGRSEAELYNLYGPTEATIDATCGICRHNDRQSVSIGRPIANAKVYLLDPHLNPVAIGVPGELYIGGAGLARGYLDRPDLTAEKFIPNPFSRELGARLYRTGDLARYLADGKIEFVGRIDAQVKIRGFRIELGEIEAVLGQHPRLREAVVLAREENQGEKRLVAYVVSSQDQTCTVSELRKFLREKLPDYMVPSAFVFLDALPLTPNGKLDRRALPAPDASRPKLEQSFVAPGTPIEEIIAEIWAEVLKLEKVGIHDNFFDLGGHSLLATQVISRIRERLQTELPLRVLFETPTVAELALQIEQSASARDKLDELACKLAEVELLSVDEAERRLTEKNT